MEKPFRITTIYRRNDASSSAGKTLIEYTQKCYYYSKEKQMLIDGKLVNAYLVEKRSTFWR